MDRTVSRDGSHARRDDGIAAQPVGLVGCSGVFHEELHIALRDFHVESAGHGVPCHRVVKRCRQVVGVPGPVEHEVRTAGRHSRIAAEGQEYRPHCAGIAVFQAEGAGNGRAAIHFRARPLRTVIAHLQELRRRNIIEEHKNGIPGLPAGLRGPGWMVYLKVKSDGSCCRLTHLFSRFKDFFPAGHQREHRRNHQNTLSHNLVLLLPLFFIIERDEIRRPVRHRFACADHAALCHLDYLDRGCFIPLSIS